MRVREKVRKWGDSQSPGGVFFKKRGSISRCVHEDEKEDQIAKEEEGMVPTKDPLRKPEAKQ